MKNHLLASVDHFASLLAGGYPMTTLDQIGVRSYFSNAGGPGERRPTKRELEILYDNYDQIQHEKAIALINNGARLDERDHFSSTPVIAAAKGRYPDDVDIG